MPTSIRRPVFPALLLFLCLVPAGALQYFAPIHLGPYSFIVGFAAGIFLLLVAVATSALAMRQLRVHGTPIEPGHEPSHLVINGPFRFTRNPLYLSIVLFVVALGVMTNSAWFAIASVLLLLLLDRLVIAQEEWSISHAFPAEYAVYKARVRRWL